MARIANRPLTKQKRPHRFADLGQVAAAIVLLIIPAFFYASQRANQRADAARIGKLEEELLRLREEREVLVYEFQALLEPRGLALRARDIAGMTDSLPEQLEYLAWEPQDAGVEQWLTAMDAPDGNR